MRNGSISTFLTCLSLLFDGFLHACLFNARYSVQNRVLVNPLKGLAEITVDTLDNDGTTVVSKIDVQSQSIPTVDESTMTATTIGLVEEVGSMTERPSLVELAAAAAAASIKLPKERREMPIGERWAIAAPGVDLSGDWSLIVDEAFKKEYQNYLVKLGQPYLVRSVALNVVHLTTESAQQSEQGRSLLICGKNLQWSWDRTLVASGTDLDVDEFTPVSIPILTAESEQVQAESWWEANGTEHVSWLRGVSKYGGGSFESRRSLQENSSVYVCETMFHRNDRAKEDVSIVWRFRRRESSESV
jgi:hypothetical protein